MLEFGEVGGAGDVRAGVQVRLVLPRGAAAAGERVVGQAAGALALQHRGEERLGVPALADLGGEGCDQPRMLWSGGEIVELVRILLEVEQQRRVGRAPDELVRPAGGS